MSKSKKSQNSNKPKMTRNTWLLVGIIASVIAVIAVVYLIILLVR